MLGSIVFIKSSPIIEDKIYNVLDNYGFSNIKHVPEILSYKLKSYFVKKEILNINIKHIDLQKIEFMRENALKGEKNFEYVSAYIDHDGESYKVDLKLKGDRDVHYSSLEKASYRVKVKKKKTLFGMNDFSLQKPRVRNYIEEWIFLEMMRGEGIVTPRYKFVNASVNGKNQGIYVIEERYTKYLVENNRNKEGPMLKFDEVTGNFRLDSIDVMEMEKWNTEANLPMLKTAVALLEGFRSNKLTIDEVFDTKKLARFFAISDLNYTWHGVITKSMRFYYNPVSMKIEPIPFDGHRGASNEPYLISAELGIVSENNWTNSKFGNWFRAFFNDSANYSQSFHEEYVQTLERISEKQYLDSFFMKHDEEISDILALIYSELPLHDGIFYYGPFPYYFSKDSYYDTQKDILAKLSFFSLAANIKTVEENIVVLEVVNKHKSLPIEMVKIFDENGNSLCEPVDYSIVFPASEFNNDSGIQDVTFNCFDNTLTEFSRKIQVEVRYPGSDSGFNLDIMPKILADSSLLKGDIVRSNENTNQFSFIEINEESKSILITKGDYVISKDMIVPAGYTFIIEKGTTIELRNNPIILSYSKLSWIGSDDERISITSNDGTNGSIVVMNASETSYISHVDFSRLAYPQLDNWNISGSLNFYKSDVDINNINISSNFSEDALNIVNSKFNIVDTNFFDIKSDALDIDFGEGNLVNSSFSNVGNDAIDSSGTTLYLNAIKILDVGDKGISAGEISFINGQKIDIKNSEIGVTSKDGSSVVLSNVNILNSKIGLTAFRKKNEYSHPYIEIDDLALVNNDINHVVEINSKVKMNGSVVEGVVKDVESMLYGNLYGKKSQKIEVEVK